MRKHPRPPACSRWPKEPPLFGHRLEASGGGAHARRLRVREDGDAVRASRDVEEGTGRGSGGCVASCCTRSASEVGNELLLTTCAMSVGMKTPLEKGLVSCGDESRSRAQSIPLRDRCRCIPHNLSDYNSLLQRLRIAMRLKGPRGNGRCPAGLMRSLRNATACGRLRVVPCSSASTSLGQMTSESNMSLDAEDVRTAPRV